MAKCSPDCQVCAKGKEPARFNVGDRIRVTDDYGAHGGHMGTVIQITYPVEPGWHAGNMAAYLVDSCGRRFGHHQLELEGAIYRSVYPEWPKTLVTEQALATEQRIETICGWRFWAVKVMDQDELRLVSISRGYVWLPYRPAESSPAPTPRGVPGIYAFKEPQTGINLRRFSSPSEPTVYGKVLLWGVIVEHERGYRAQYAYPLSLTGACCNECQAAVEIKGLRTFYQPGRAAGFICYRCQERTRSALNHLLAPAALIIERLEREYGLEVE